MSRMCGDRAPTIRQIDRLGTGSRNATRLKSFGAVVESEGSFLEVCPL